MSEAGSAPEPTGARVSIYDAIDANRRRTVVLIASFLLIVAALGFVLGELVVEGAGLFVLPVAVGASGLWALTSYFAGDRIVLGVSRARQVSAEQEPRLHNVVEALCLGAGLPKPRLYVIEDAALNAFATGRDPKHASVAVTRGLLEKLDRTELEGVMAHELSHIRNYDIRVLLVAAVLIGAVAMLADMLLRTLWYTGGRGARSGGGRGGGGGALLLLAAAALAIVAPIVAQLVRLAISREREFLADASGALLTRYPPGLASALRKISSEHTPMHAANKAVEALYIHNPLKDTRRYFDGLFETHPPVAERIRRLEAM